MTHQSHQPGERDIPDSENKNELSGAGVCQEKPGSQGGCQIAQGNGEGEEVRQERLPEARRAPPLPITAL